MLDALRKLSATPKNKTGRASTGRSNGRSSASSSTDRSVSSRVSKHGFSDNMHFPQQLSPTRSEPLKSAYDAEGVFPLTLTDQLGSLPDPYAPSGQYVSSGHFNVASGSYNAPGSFYPHTGSHHAGSHQHAPTDQFMTTAQAAQYNPADTQLSDASMGQLHPVTSLPPPPGHHHSNTGSHIHAAPGSMAPGGLPHVVSGFQPHQTVQSGLPGVPLGPQPAAGQAPYMGYMPMYPVGAQWDPKTAFLPHSPPHEQNFAPNSGLTDEFGEKRRRVSNETLLRKGRSLFDKKRAVATPQGSLASQGSETMSSQALGSAAGQAPQGTRSARSSRGSLGSLSSHFSSHASSVVSSSSSHQSSQGSSKGASSTGTPTAVDDKTLPRQLYAAENYSGFPFQAPSLPYSSGSATAAPSSASSVSTAATSHGSATSSGSAHPAKYGYSTYTQQQQQQYQPTTPQTPSGATHHHGELPLPRQLNFSSLVSPPQAANYKQPVQTHAHAQPPAGQSGQLYNALGTSLAPSFGYAGQLAPAAQIGAAPGVHPSSQITSQLPAPAAGPITSGPTASAHMASAHTASAPMATGPMASGPMGPMASGPLNTPLTAAPLTASLTNPIVASAIVANPLASSSALAHPVGPLPGLLGQSAAPAVLSKPQVVPSLVAPPRRYKPQEVALTRIVDGRMTPETTLDCDDDGGHYIVKVGERFAWRYLILKLLGQGTFGKVVQAWDERTQQYCAIKIIRAIPKYRDASKVELRVLTLLSGCDPNNSKRCVRMRECFDYRNHVCIVTDLHDISVYDFLHDNRFAPFPGRHIASFAAQILASVAHIHSLGLVHTDLKPENVLLSSSASTPAVYYVGTGATSAAASHSHSTHSAHSHHKSKVRTNNRKELKSTEVTLIDFGSAVFDDEYHPSVVSTRHYRAPEIILGTGWSYACDLWSIGCLLVELCTGRVLFETRDDLEHLHLMQRTLQTSFGAVQLSKAARTGVGAQLVNQWPPELKALKDETKNESVKHMRTIRELVHFYAPYSRDRKFWSGFLDLVSKLMKTDPAERITAAEALQHPWILTAS